MPNQQELELLERSHRTHNSLWVLLMVSLVVYLVVCHVVDNQFLQSTPSDTLIRDLIFLMALGAVILAMVVRRLLLKVKPGRPLTLLAPMVCAKAVERYRTALFISLAFAEAVAMYGLILFFIGYGLANLYLFTALSALSLYLLRPRYGELEAFFLAQRKLLS